MEYRRRQGIGHTPITINGKTVERVKSLKFLGVHIRKNLTWIHHNAITKMTRQWLLFLCRLRRFNMDTRILCNFYRCTIESILT